MTPCNPRNPLAVCPTCARHNPRISHLAENRGDVVCMDVASILAEGSRCPLHVQREASVYWWNNEPEEVVAA